MGYGYGYYLTEIEQDGSPYYSTYFYIKHTFHDVDNLLFACDNLKKGNDTMVKYYYEKIIDTLPTTVNKHDFFLQDFDDCCDSLRREGVDLKTHVNHGQFVYNKFSRDGCNDMIIEQFIGVCGNYEATSIREILERELKSLTNN